MRTAFLTLMGFFVATASFGQQNGGVTSVDNQKAIGRGQMLPSAYAVVQRDANSRVWQRTTYERLPSGELISHVHSYTELATGMHYQKDGQWIESKEEIDVVPTGGAAALQGQYQAYFPYDIYDGVIEIATPDGEHLKARPLAISYFDGTNNVLIGQLTNAVGLLVSSNQVLYTNAFTDIDADLLCTYRRAGFECDLVFRSQPPIPEIYGLNSSDTRLELLTEFFDTPEPQQIASQTPETPLQTASVLNPSATQGLAAVPEIPDTTLRFGSMTMIRGKAFTVNGANNITSSTPSSAPAANDATLSDNAVETPVSKTWTKIEGRTFLIEEVPVASVSAGLQSLPAMQSSGRLTQHKVSTSRLLPPSRIALSGKNAMKMASAGVNRPSMVMDYNMVYSQTNLTFRGDSTYYVSGAVNLSGTNVIEGGTVIKYDTNSDCTINILGYIQCRTGPYQPAIFTSADDGSVGESASSSSPPSCSTTFNLSVQDDTGENLTISVYDDNDTLVASGNVSAGNYTVLSFTAGLGQHFIFDAFDEDANEYYVEFWTSQQNGGIDTYYDPDYGPSAGYVGLGGTLCTPLTVASTALSLANGGNLNDLIIRYVGTGIKTSAACNVTNIQVVQCKQAFETDNTSLYAGNVLISGTSKAFAGYGFTAKSEQLTYDNGDYVAYSTSGTSTASLTNAIITGVANWALNTTVNTNQAFKYASSSGVYQTVGAGSYYLATNSSYRDIGTTNINAALLASLRQKTTYAPIVYTNITISTNAVLAPRAIRDVDAPDIGYHYYPMDYVFSGVSVSSNLTISAGTAIGWFKPASGTPAIRLANKTVMAFNGQADSPDYFVRTTTVQENSATWGGISDYGIAGSQNQTNISFSSELDMNFTLVSGSAGWNQQFKDYSGYLIVRANNSTISGGNSGGFWISCYYTNCLMDNQQVGTVAGHTGNEIYLRNCTLHNGIFYGSRTTRIPISVRDCAFDQVMLYQVGDSFSSDPTNTDYSYNAYTNATDPFPSPGGASHDQVSVSFNWQQGPLGRFYLPTNSVLINTGHTTADLVGLYHFTTQTNQVEEANSTVDIGYHYIDFDSDGDGLGDGWELKYFGTLAYAATNVDSGGVNTLLYDYTNGVDPNIIDFSLFFPNQYVSTNIVAATITILAGTPSYYALLIDNTNFGTATWTFYTSSNITVNLGSTQGAHNVWLGLRGLPSDAQQTWQETTLILDSVPPSILITNPVNNASFNASRIDIHGNFTAGSLKDVIVNGVLAFVSGTNFAALGVPLNAGSNAINAVVEDFTGTTNAASINVNGLTNSDGSVNDPVQLGATPIAGFAPLAVTFQITSNSAPGTFQEAFYDFNGDGIADFVTNNVSSFSYTYTTSGEYFPVATIQTSAGFFSSSGGWNSIDANRLQVTVQSGLTQTVFASVSDPVDLKLYGMNLYVLSGSGATITEFDTNASTIRSLSGLGTNPSGFDVDAAGNVYIAITSSNQIWKFIPTNSSFVADTSFGVGGRIGLVNGSSGAGTGEFNAPFDVAVSPDGGTISVSDSGNNRIQQFTINGTFVASFGTNGSAVGQFSTPKGLAYDSSGTLYIVDTGNNRVTLAQGAFVEEVTGTNGTSFGQFSSPVNISFGEHGVYVSDSGNNRIQSFNSSIPHVPFSADSSTMRFAISTNLNQPLAVAARDDDLTTERFYVADAGNNRVIFYSLTPDDPTRSWTNLTMHAASGDIEGALSNFSITSENDYRQAFLAVGTTNAISAISQAGTLTPVYINDTRAEYYFTNTIDGQVITFPVEFNKENGIWKILEF